MDGAEKKFYIIIIVLIVILLGGIAFFIVINTQKTNMTLSLEQKNELVIEQLQSANDEISTHLGTIVSLNAELLYNEEELLSNEEELLSNEEELSSVQDDLKDALIAKEYYQELVEVTNCPTIWIMNYTSNSTISDSLKYYIKGEYGSIEGYETEWIEYNPSIAYHYFMGDYWLDFIVYFDEARMGYRNAVFDITRQCWIDFN